MRDALNDGCAGTCEINSPDLAPTCRSGGSAIDYRAVEAIHHQIEGHAMRFICLGYADETKWAEMSEADRVTFVDECFAYDDVLRRGGHFLGGEALGDVRKGATLRFQDGQVTVHDGPFIETKEHLGGILILEARDLKHAIELMSRHPGVRCGHFEIRGANEEINALIDARNRQIAMGSQERSSPEEINVMIAARNRQAGE